MTPSRVSCWLHFLVPVGILLGGLMDAWEGGWTLALILLWQIERHLAKIRRTACRTTLQ